MRLNGTTVFTSLKFSDGSKIVPTDVQILRTGNFSHPTYGKFEITTKVLAEMKANFDLRVRGVDLAFDYFHDSDKEASAWVNDLTLKENGTELWANVTWTPKAEQKLSERELRYFSPDFAFQWQDPETGTKYSNVLFGGGLTNRPFLKEMQAIVADEKQRGIYMTELEKLQAELKAEKEKSVKLSEDKAGLEAKLAAVPPPAAPAKEEGDEVAALKKTIADLQAQLAKAQADSSAMMAEKEKAQAAVKMAEKETAFNVLLSEGKAVAAQKDSFMKDDMTSFIKLAQPVNLRPAGSSQTEVVDADAAAIIKLAEDKQKANPKLSRGDAISIAKKELKK